MKPKPVINKKGIEKLLNKGQAIPVPYSDCVIVCLEKSIIVKVVEGYELYQPIGDIYVKVPEIKYFQKIK